MEKTTNLTSTFMSFKRQEVIGNTKEEALAKAPFEIMGDATQAYKLWKAKQVNGITDTSIKQFMLDYLNKKSKNVPGVGFAITLESAIADTRERPYTLTRVKNEKGVRKFEKTYQIIDNETRAILAETNKTKADAENLGKELYTKKGYKGNFTCVVTRQVKGGGECVAFTGKYTPSKSARTGRYLVFGFERV